MKEGFKAINGHRSPVLFFGKVIAIEINLYHFEALRRLFSRDKDADKNRGLQVFRHCEEGSDLTDPSDLSDEKH